MPRVLCAMLAALLVSTGLSVPPAERLPDPYPGKAWAVADPVALGWSRERLAAAHAYANTLPSSSVVVIDRGREIAAWGDAGKRIKLSSMRKSLLSALYGIYTPGDPSTLDATLADLGIDDDPPLTPLEKTATIRMLLEARSGIYHGYVAGTPAMRDGWPRRGSHVPGSFWFYNNWDFNALGTIFEKQFMVPIARAFEEKIARPTRMQDFRLEDMYYVRAPAKASPDFNQSIHPAYHFRMSARDVARFGYLFLRQGVWSGKEVVPHAWVAQSTQSHSQAGPDEGYGYLWWTDGFDLREKSFSAQGALAKYLVIVPERDLVVVYLNHQEFPDDAEAYTSEQLKRLPTISHEQMSRLLKLLLDAQRPAPSTLGPAMK